MSTCSSAVSPISCPSASLREATPKRSSRRAQIAFAGLRAGFRVAHFYGCRRLSYALRGLSISSPAARTVRCLQMAR